MLTACMNGNEGFLNGNDFLLSFCVIPTSKAPCNSVMPCARDAQGFFFIIIPECHLSTLMQLHVQFITIPAG